MADAYHADRSWRAKLRRRAVRLTCRRPARAPDRPMVSFTFDDAAASAAEIGATILEDRGLRGSYYIAAALAGTETTIGRTVDRDAVRRLADVGHEVGCHTYSHLDCGQARACDAVEDVALNAETLTGWGLPQPTTFAYPYGDVAPATKRALAGRFALLRALHPGLVTAGADLNQAPALAVDGAEGEERALAWLARAERETGWLILCFHDIAEPASAFGCAPRTLAHIANRAIERRFDVVTVAEGAARLAA